MKDERTAINMDAMATIAEIERLEGELSALESKAAQRRASEDEQTTRLKNRSYRTSVIATVLFTLLIFVVFSAQTYAYFTDSVQSFNNSIQSGNLKISTVESTGSVSLDGLRVMPATDVARGVDVQNTGSLNSYVRAKIQIKINDNEVSESVWEDLIQFNVNTETVWTRSGDYYYYTANEGVVAANAKVNLFTTITFLSTMGNDYTNSTIEITVLTDAVQSDFNGTGPLGATWSETP